MKTREEIIEAVLRDPSLQHLINNSADGAGAEQVLREKARRYLLEIASDYNEGWLRIWKRVLALLWRFMYDDFIIDRQGIERIREISRQMPLVFIPSHRSHLDYLILAYILYINGIPLPRVAAGINMNFWPLGRIFRQSGAFFLRRSFQGDELYAQVFSAYVGALLKDGVPIEFFIEGGRSRTGKMLTPKYGMLSMVIRAYQESGGDNMALIPVSVGYDRVVEENAYLRELGGAPKKSESFIDVLKHAKIMLRRYGRVYMHIGEPVYLKPYQALEKPLKEMDKAKQQSLYREIGTRVVSEINGVTAVSAVSLVAASLICHNLPEIPGNLLKSTYAALYKYLRSREGLNMAPDLLGGEDPVPAVLELFKQWGYLTVQMSDASRENSRSYLVPPDKRLNLEYYKNHIIQHFLPVSLVALSIVQDSAKAVPLTNLADDCRFLRRLLRHEFIFSAEIDGETEAAMAYLEKSGIIERKGEACMATEEGREKLSHFAGLLRSYLESYWVTFNAFSPGEKNMPAYLGRVAREMHAKGRLLRPESLFQENFNNAFKLLLEETAVCHGRGLANENGQGKASVFDAHILDSLRRRLAEFMP